ncbi:hypothetical protein V6N13_083453 [Hibiscus sabdariffa]
MNMVAALRDLYGMKEWQLGFRHVLRLHNNTVDRLATLGRSSSRNGQSFPSPHADLALLIEEEKVRSAGEVVIPWDSYAAANVVCFNMHSDSRG